MYETDIDLIYIYIYIYICRNIFTKDIICVYDKLTNIIYQQITYAMRHRINYNEIKNDKNPCKSCCLLNVIITNENGEIRKRNESLCNAVLV